MKLGFLPPGDPSKVTSYSGIPYFSYNALQRVGHDLVPIDAGDIAWSPLTNKLNHLGKRAFGKNLLVSNLSNGWVARRASASVKAAGLDALICENIDLMLGAMRVDVPVILHSDTTLAAISDYYPSFSNLFGPTRRSGEARAQAAYDIAAYLAFPSEWAAQSAVSDYGVPQDRVHVIPYGANLSDPPSATAEPREMGDECRFLFIGADWDRKGGAIAFETMKALKGEGKNVSMVAVGGHPKDDHPGLRKIGFLNKQVPEEAALYRQLWDEATFLFMPSRQETFGAIYAEAAAHGLPVIASDTGGVSGCVVDGESGVLLSPDAKPADYATAISDLMGAPERYASLARGARARYEQVLNWDAWARSMVDLAERAVSEKENL